MFMGWLGGVGSDVKISDAKTVFGNCNLNLGMGSKIIAEKRLE